MPDLRRPCAPRLIEAASRSAATIKGGKPAPSASASCWSGENPVTQRSSKQGAAKVCGPDDLILAQALVRRMPVGEKVMESILTLVRAARPDSDHDETKGLIAWGPGPRASQAFMLAARARG